ncbi:Auxin-responsive protein SAUR32-like protein [Drosera capensis]
MDEKGLIRSLSYMLLHHHHNHRYVHSVSGTSGGGGEVRVDVPKGCMAIRVGEGDDEDDKERFVVPVMYLNHPLFSRLLKAAEEVYGFDQKGTISIPCSVKEFREVVGLIDEEMGFVHHHDHHHKNGHDHNHHHRPIAGCFRA